MKPLLIWVSYRHSPTKTGGMVSTKARQDCSHPTILNLMVKKAGEIFRLFRSLRIKFF